MSAPDYHLAAGDGTRVRFGTCATDFIELAAHRGRSDELATIAARRGLSLPAFGRAVVSAAHLAISVRPDRWLLLTAPATPGLSATAWQDACTSVAAAIDQSSGLAALYLAGPDSAALLARGCRLDLHPDMFPAGQAAATSVAQVPVIIVRLRFAWLLLTPSTTARHFAEWLAASGAPFGITQTAAVPFAALTGELFS